MERASTQIQIMSKGSQEENSEHGGTDSEGSQSKSWPLRWFGIGLHEPLAKHKIDHLKDSPRRPRPRHQSSLTSMGSKDQVSQWLVAGAWAKEKLLEVGNIKLAGSGAAGAR